MKITLITGHYPPPYTANGIRAMYMVKALISKNFDVRVIQLLSLNNTKQIREGFYGETVFIPYRNLPKQVEKPHILNRILDLAKKRNIEDIFFYLREFEPDIVIGTLPPIEGIPIALRVAQKYNAKLIADIQDLSDEYKILEKPYLAPLVRLLFRKVYKTLKKSDIIVATTEFAASILKNRVGKNVFVVPNGADTEFFKQCFELKYRRKTKEHPLAAFLGDLNWKYHALDKFIKAVAMLSKGKLNVQLRVMGTGKLANYYKNVAKKEGIEDLIEFLGYVPREELPKLLSEADFAIVGRPAIENLWIKSSIRLTAYEYIACGLPIFAYGPPNSYTQYFIENNNIGVYVPTDEPSELAKGLKNNLKKILSIDSAHVRKIGEKYNWNSVMTTLTKLLLEDRSPI